MVIGQPPNKNIDHENEKSKTICVSVLNLEVIDGHHEDHSYIHPWIYKNVTINIQIIVLTNFSVAPSEIYVIISFFDATLRNYSIKTNSRNIISSITVMNPLQAILLGRVCITWFRTATFVIKLPFDLGIGADVFFEFIWYLSQ